MKEAVSILSNPEFWEYYFNNPLIKEYLRLLIMIYGPRIFILLRNYDVKNVKVVKEPPKLELDFKDIKFNEQQRVEYNQALKIFYECLQKKCPHLDETLLFNNLKTLEIKESVVYNYFMNCIASYNPLTNNISANSKNMWESIFHELFHVLSSYVYKCFIYTGFSQKNLLTLSIIGNGLNEGYTQLMAERYFPDYETKRSYIIEKYFAKYLEHIIGRKKMETLYSESNLKGLIEELRKFTTDEEIMLFIRNLDYIYNHKNNLVFKRGTRKVIIDCCQFLVMCYAKKQKIRLENQEITEEMYTSKVRNFIKKIYKNLDFDNYYNFIKKGEIKNLKKISVNSMRLVLSK